MEVEVNSFSERLKIEKELVSPSIELYYILIPHRERECHYGMLNNL